MHITLLPSCAQGQDKILQLVTKIFMNSVLDPVVSNAYRKITEKVPALEKYISVGETEL